MARGCDTVPRGSQLASRCGGACTETPNPRLMYRSVSRMTSWAGRCGAFTGLATQHASRSCARPVPHYPRCSGELRLDGYVPTCYVSSRAATLEIKPWEAPPTGVRSSMSSAASTELAQAPAPAFHAYLDFKAIQRDPASLVENCRRRGASADPERVAALYGQFLELQQAADRVRAERNQNSAQMKVKWGESVCLGGGGGPRRLRLWSGPVGGPVDSLQGQAQGTCRAVRFCLGWSGTCSAHPTAFYR